VLTARASRPRVRLRNGDATARQLDLRDYLCALRILWPHDVDSGEKRRDSGKQARLGNVAAWADAPTEAEACRAGVTDRRV
jgi:hypothetical protein